MGVDGLIHLVQNRDPVVDCREHSNKIVCFIKDVELASRETISFPRRTIRGLF